MTRRARTLLRLLTLAALASGCEQVGSPIVDYVMPIPEPEGAGAVRCNQPPPCDDPVLEIAEQDLHAIGRVRVLRDCALGELAACGPLSARDADAGPPPHLLYGCRLRTPVSGLDGYDLSEAACSNVTLEVQPDDSRNLLLEGVSWSKLNLSVTSATPFALELAQAEMDHVAIELEGPITLRLTESAVNRLRVHGTATAEGEPRVEFESVTAETLWIGDERAFPGSFDAVRSTLSQVQLVAAAMALESTGLTHGMVDIGRLDAADSGFVSLSLRVEDGLMSVCQFEQMVVQRCGNLTLVGSEFDDSVLWGCDSLLRVYSTNVLRSALDGPIESDRSSWEGTRLGLRSATDVVAWGGYMASTNVCAETRSARFSGVSLRCNDCADAYAQRGAVCLDTLYPSQLSSNWCSAFDDPPICSDALPRERPITSD